MDTIFKLSVLVNMIDNLTSPAKQVNSTVDNTASTLNKLQAGFGGIAKTGVALTTFGKQLTQTILDPVQATFATKKALGELASVGVKDLKTVEDAAKQFSDTWSGTTKADFISAAGDIKGGIYTLTDEGVAEFTRMAALTAKGTKATVGEMTSLFATGYGIYKDFYKNMTDVEFGEMFSAGIAQAVNIFKTEGSSMAQSIQTLGAAATSAQIPLEEQFSILGMLQATMSGSEAGTKYKAFLGSAANAGKELGISFMDANKQLLSMPEILTKLHGKFGDTVDAVEKMQLKKAFGTDEAVAVIDLMYSKTDQLQESILDMYKSLGEGTNIANEMAEAMNNDPSAKYEILTQKFHNLKEELGNQLLPTVNELINTGNQWLAKISSWVNENKELAGTIMKVVLFAGILITVLGVIATGIGIVGFSITNIGKGFGVFKSIIQGIPGALDTVKLYGMYAGDALKSGLTNAKIGAKLAADGIKDTGIAVINFAKTAAINGVNAVKSFVTSMYGMAKQAVITAVQAMPGLIGSVWSFTAALLANPVTWIVIGIVALIAAIILLWQNWDSVVIWIQNIWKGFINAIKVGFDWIMNLFSGMPLWLQIAVAAFLPFIGIPLLIISNWDSITGFFSNVWSNITTSFSNGIQGIKDYISGTLTWFRESGAKIMTTFTEGIKSALASPYETVKDGLAKVRKLLPFSDAKEGPLSTLTLSGRRIFETIGAGMEQSSPIIKQQTHLAFEGATTDFDSSLLKFDNNSAAYNRFSSVEKVNLKETFKEKQSEKETVKSKGSKERPIINVYFDTKDIKGLKNLFTIIEQLEDYDGSSEDSGDDKE